MAEWADIWAYLPAFRAVAETQHLPTAASRLHVSPSALSRSVKLLEGELGHPLFERSGRRLVLNDAGARLLAGLQQAVLQVENHMEAGRPEGPVEISATGLLTPSFLLPALDELHRSNPDVVPHLLTLSTQEANRRLKQGSLAIAFYTDAVDDPDLTIQHLGMASIGLYCGAEHPLAATRSLTFEELGEVPFVIPFAGAQGVPTDGWPVDHPRLAGMITDSLRVRITVCLQGQLLSVLPDPVVRTERESGTLVRLPLDIPSRLELFAAFRRATPTTRLILGAVAEKIEKYASL